MKKVAFICKANVQRSQIAEWLFKKYHPNIEVISFAWVEARKQKYHWVTEKSVCKIAKELDWVDIFQQNINYISDFDNKTLEKIDIFYFLFDPNIDNISEKETFIQWYSPYEYIKNHLKANIKITPITDPYQASENEKLRIYNDIKKLILNINLD